MKLTIELNDNDLKKAIDEQVAKGIAELTTASIKAQVDQILKIKFERVTDNLVLETLRTAADQAVRSVTSRSYNDAVVRDAIAQAAMKLLKEKT